MTQTVVPADSSPRRRGAMIAGLVAAAMLVMPAAALAQGRTKPSAGSTGGSSGAFALASESAGNNPNSPSWCMNEDDYDQRVFSGALSGSYTTSQRLCGSDDDYYNGVYWSAGGIGVETDVYAVGTLSDLSITSPSGEVHHAQLVGQSTSKGTTTYHYAACFVPTYAAATDTGGRPLDGGAYAVAISGQLKSARLAVNSQMTDVRFQQAYCPTSQQNIT